MSDITAQTSIGKAAPRAGLRLSARVVPMALVYSLISAIMVLSFTLPGAKGSVLSDNDDVMRLVEVRDFLGGQGWFDLMQYRLGLADGTLMHWSRLIDLPISLLIRFFSLFLAVPRAEEWAATVWPMLLMPFVLLPLGLAARRLAGVAAMHVALGFGGLFLLSCVRFVPGSLDHHNVQLALAMWITAMLVDPKKRATSYAIAGFACAVALAIGAETTPFVGVACICVALLWMWHGQSFATPARAFGLSLTISITALFLLTIPPHSYAVVTCDNLSLGFYAPSAAGGALLALLASLPKEPPRLVRVGLAAAAGGVLLLTTWVIAPQCLGDPLGTLDPMLVKLWLNGVSEARSIRTEAIVEPEMVGGFYAIGLFAITVCLFRAIRNERREFHLVMLALVGVSWAVALMQVRGAFFSNLLGILPLTLLVINMRQATARNPKNIGLALGYVATVLATVPSVWAVGGLLLLHGPWKAGSLKALTGGSISANETGECSDTAGLAALGRLPLGVVAAPSNSGTDILRATGHRVISAPYHRDQKGMLTELYVGLAQPDEALAFLKGAGVTIIAFCPTDPQTDVLMRMKPDGLYAALAKGKVPAYLQPVGNPAANGFRLYEVKAGSN